MHTYTHLYIIEVTHKCRKISVLQQYLEDVVHDIEWTLLEGECLQMDFTASDEY